MQENVLFKLKGTNTKTTYRFNLILFQNKCSQFLS